MHARAGEVGAPGRGPSPPTQGHGLRETNDTGGAPRVPRGRRTWCGKMSRRVTITHSSRSGARQPPGPRMRARVSREVAGTKNSSGSTMSTRTCRPHWDSTAWLSTTCGGGAGVGGSQVVRQGRQVPRAMQGGAAAAQHKLVGAGPVAPWPCSLAADAAVAWMAGAGDSSGRQGRSSVSGTCASKLGRCFCLPAASRP